jgi:hypothetical protein
VVGCVGVGDSEADWDTIEETVMGKRMTLAGEVVAHVKDQFVLANTKFATDHQRLISPPIDIGSDSFQQPWLLGVKRPEFNLHALRGTTVGSIEDVGAEPGRHES